MKRESPGEKDLKLSLRSLLCGTGFLVEFNGTRVRTLAEEDYLNGDIVTKMRLASF